MRASSGYRGHAVPVLSRASDSGSCLTWRLVCFTQPRRLVDGGKYTSTLLHGYGSHEPDQR